MRPTRIQCFMETAHVWAKRSTCFRLNVGAIVAIGNNIVSQGYNGAPAGEPHCTGNKCPGRYGCTLTLHAEYNALSRAPESGDKDLYVTHSPCASCVEYILRRGVRNVYFSTPYRKVDALARLIEHGVAVNQVMPSGWVMDWHSKELVGDYTWQKPR